ncbi:MAG: response regulator, partial [Proteobacteria bacterium]
MKEAPLRLLYIDDDPGLGRLVQRQLGRAGYEVEVQTSGPEGLQRLTEETYDAVALDHYMPGQDGLETLAAIRALPDPPPVIYVTGTQESRVAIAALKAGAADYVIKEIQGDFVELLGSAIQDAVEKVELRRAREAAEIEVRSARDRFEALAAERALLLREMNHRVANSLQIITSLLAVQAGAAQNAQVKDALTSAGGRVSAVARVHRRLYTSE